jgi:ribonucleoside-diphosphate reductase alpha chain
MSIGLFVFYDRIKMTTYDEALLQSIKYFNGEELPAKVFLDKYAVRDIDGDIKESTPDAMHRRMAKEFARIEAKKFKDPYTEEFIFDLFKNFQYIIPQGSPMYGIGNPYQIVSLSNCYVLETPADSYNSILDVDKQLVNISKRRGGVGIDLSNLRPKGFNTNNAARTTTGVVSWMERYSNSIREVGQGGRRGALMLTLSIHHPDILDFITVKNDPSKVTGANISVRLTQEFLDAVKSESDYELRFPLENPIYTKKVSAKEIWDKIINSAWLRAEPGLLMWDNILKGPADAYLPSESTNPCSELPLSVHDSCRLLILNLLSFVVNPYTPDAYFDYGKFYEYSQIAQRLMDDLVDLESEAIDRIINKVLNDPEPLSMKQAELDLWYKIKYTNDSYRRTGTGITALGDTLAAMGVKYGSDESVVATEEIYKTLKFGCYRSSVDMAKELGYFKDWSAEVDNTCDFFKNDDDILFDLIKDRPQDPALVTWKEIYADMQKYGRRNIACTTTAPAGSVSIEAQTTSGFEPAWKLSMIRRKKINPGDKNSRVDFVDKMGDSWQEFEVYHPQLKKWMEVTGETDITKSPWHGACADDIDWVQRVKMQAAAQKHVCHAISSTVNLPEHVTQETVAQIYQTAFECGLKGITVYRNNCRTGVLVDKKAEKKVDLERPKTIKCDVFHVSAKQQSYFVLVGILNDKPYEVFAGKNGFIPKAIKSGKISKKSAGYKVEFDDSDLELSPITASMDEMEEVISRLTSGLLRSGIDMHFVVKQLEKVGERQSDLNSFSRSVARVLKKYIPDGTKEGEKCPECSGDLVRSEGCISCPSCGYSKCT